MFTAHVTMTQPGRTLLREPQGETRLLSESVFADVPSPPFLPKRRYEIVFTSIWPSSDILNRFDLSFKGAFVCRGARFL
jgi:hypothetical protein